ncbi:HD domain-containing protein [Candidatus Wolfebacteria bacterium]|nr:HD domain-containing protein [Candidatus Wolfebacteria bacterium]
MLAKKKYEAYLVGGCVRDLLRRTVHGELVEPNDWDIATNARPEEVQKIFPDSFYENEFGTVGVKVTNSQQPTTDSPEIVEVTSYRIEGKYSDRRRPDEVRFAKTIEEDLSRRDFTINAIALEVGSGKLEVRKLIDPFGGQADLAKKLIRAVGDPHDRFNEDGLRLMRAVRLATELCFKIEKKTLDALRNNARLLNHIAEERIRDELVRIIMADHAMSGIELLEETGLLAHILPELREGINVTQNKHHIYTVWEHNLRALDYAATKKYPFEVRLASLLHDVGKPRAKRGEGPDATFHGHDVVGAKMTAKMLERLHFSTEVVCKVSHLIRYHLFYYNVGEVTEAGVRRFLARVGPENIPDLIKVREADRIGSGVPKAVPYKLRHLLYMIEKVKKDPLSPKMLKVNGEDVMQTLGIPPGPRVGQILAILLEDVLDDPGRNTAEVLEKRVKELGAFDDNRLLDLAKKARGKKDEFESGAEEEMKGRYYVK